MAEFLTATCTANIALCATLRFGKFPNMIVKPAMVKFNTAAVVLFPVLKGKVMFFQKLLNSG